MDKHKSYTKPFLHTVNCECGNRMAYFKWDRENSQSLHACTNCSKTVVVREYKKQKDEISGCV